MIKGTPQLSWSIHIEPSPSSEYYEAKAILEGLLKCEQLNIANAITCNDSQLIIQCLKQENFDNRAS